MQQQGAYALECPVLNSCSDLRLEAVAEVEANILFMLVMFECFVIRLDSRFI